MLLKLLKLFLSHLCGGECSHHHNRHMARFLSHLCGGESIPDYGSSTAKFLSHLCGGELAKVEVPF
ncbi:hypothetical protein BAZOLSSOX_540 [uncultured Gammaproteobacteria bacterium]|nr:hypothetical protein BAZOLSSOX_540 [uncultured Gammaproteobacteria bacterium]